MRGHENIIAMRRQGFRPAIVFLNDYPCDTNWFDHKEHATVCTAGDSISGLDLRFLTGLVVSLTSTDENRAKALLEACKGIGAKKVAASQAIPVNEYRCETGWWEIWEADRG